MRFLISAAAVGTVGWLAWLLVEAAGIPLHPTVIGAAVAGAALSLIPRRKRSRTTA